MICVLPTTRAVEAFSVMHYTGRSAIGVTVEPRGPLVDVISVSDLRGMSRDGFVLDMHLSVEAFTRKRRPIAEHPRTFFHFFLFTRDTSSRR